MTNTLYYINIPLPEELSKNVKNIELKWQGRNSASEPHITLVIPGPLKPGNAEEELLKALDDLLELREFSVEMVGIGQFNRRRVVYIKINSSPELLGCHRIVNKVVDGMLGLNKEKQPFRPHITLAKGLSPKRGAEAWVELSKSDWTGTFCCQHIQLLRKKDNERQWSVIQSFELRK